MQEKYLKEAISIAVKNVEKGGGPFGAVIVKDGKIIASAGNSVTLDNDPTAHAEVQAIRKAAEKLRSWDLSGCTLYSSCEPCPMCLGAVYWSHLDQVVYACTNIDARNAGFDDTYIYNEIKLDPQKRMIPMVQQLRNEGLEAFRAWENMPDKEEY